ncbi:MAG: acyl-CoA dehydrogenase family protein [Pseudomonadota bacterium]
MANLTGEERALRDMVRSFCAREVAPAVPGMEADDAFPTDLFRRAGEVGLLGLYVADAFGGADAGDTAFMIVSEELARTSASFAVAVSCHVGVSTLPIVVGGADAVRARLLPGLASGRLIGGFALTEPDTGSDAGALRTRAVLRGDRWILDGVKTLITNGAEADTFVVMARTGPGRGAAGISAFVVERDAPGLTVGKPMAKMGLKGNSTTQLYFEDCAVPRENLLGSEGEGFRVAMRALDVGRLSVAAISLGVAKRALEISLDYASDRTAFGAPIIEYQALGHRLADVAAECDLTERYLYDVARNHGERFVREASVAKLFASELAGRACDLAVQVFGGMGFMKETEAERLYRDARVLRIFEGTSEIQRRVILKELRRRL